MPENAPPVDVGEPQSQHLSEKQRVNFMLGKSLSTDSWRSLATLAGFPHELLNPGEVEILDMFERVVIRGKGWSKKDKLRNIRDCIPISPRKLSKKGKKLSPRTYQKGISRLQKLGLLIHSSTGADQVRVFACGWWPKKSREDVVLVWDQAAAAMDKLKSRESD